ncbi:MAG: thioredoxin-dependent thiol peroxidase [Rhodobacteraceae bacterium]|jgi:peroxiredoxin Q/BCP|nr:thioredoxin-dependent thiol peroxidase [Paracoccaceae bacterium]
MPAIGQPAPSFTLPRDGGTNVSLADYAGQIVVLYFYPKDDTPGCTTEAIDFSAEAEAFAKAGAVVLGVSRDTVKKHEKFRDKHGLKVALLADEDGAVCEAYGVWVEKSMYGRTYMGIERTTFLIGRDGKITRVWDKVKVKDHAAEVLAAVSGL